MQQATLIVYRSAGVHKHVKPDNYNVTGSPLKKITINIQEQAFLDFLSPLFELELIWF